MILEFRYAVGDRVVISALNKALPGETGVVVGRHKGPTGLPEYSVRLDRTVNYSEDWEIPEHLLRRDS